MSDFTSATCALFDPALVLSRAQYFDSLLLPQDFYSESLNANAPPSLLRFAGEDVGHCLTRPDGALLEFFVHDERLAEPAFEFLLATRAIELAIGKSSDPLFARLALGRASRVTVLGLHFAEIEDARFEPNPAIQERVARPSDLAALNAINDGFFDSDHEIALDIRRGHITLFENEGATLGCGLIQPVVAGRAWRDIGMLVNPAMRRRGIGRHIVRRLKAACLAEGLQPICACGVENEASRACLTAAGFRQTGRIWEVEVSEAIGPNGRRSITRPRAPRSPAPKIPPSRP